MTAISFPFWGKYFRLWTVGILLFSFGQFACSNADKQGIVLVAFGTTVPEANAAYINIEKQVKAAFPDAVIRWAYTSSFVRKKLAKKGIDIPSPKAAIEQMHADGFKTIYVQSLHVIPGSEFDNLAFVVDDFNDAYNDNCNVLLGDPLMYSPSDMRALSSVVINIIPAARKSSEALVLMGHGTSHASNIYYPGLQYYLWQADTTMFVGCVEGYPSLNEVIKSLKRSDVRKVWLMPLMIVAGDHARNDMAGTDDDSWKSRLEKEGFSVEVVLHGLGEENAIALLFVDHLSKLMHQAGDIK